MAYDDFRRGARQRYEDRVQPDRWRERNESRNSNYGAYPYESGGNLASRQRDDYGDAGRSRRSQRVSPGGEYVGNRSPSYWPQRYESDSYTNQGYGQNRGRNDWRTEDGLFGEVEERGALDSAYGRGYENYPGPYVGMDEEQGPRRSGSYSGNMSYGQRSASGFGYGGYQRPEDSTYGYGSEAYRGEHRGKGPKGYRRSDDRIREDVCDCLSDDPRIDASSIEVSVKDCEVTLSGTVSSRLDKRLAEDLSESIAGVRDVHNTLRVSMEQNAQSNAQQSNQSSNYSSKH